MTIQEYLEAEGRKLYWLADKAGIDKSNLSRIANGHQKPLLETALAIEKATGGKVTRADLP